jgi:L-rhamnose mutarotase
MNPMQQPLPNVPAGHRWLEVPEVFHFDGTPLSANDTDRGTVHSGDNA